MEQQNLPQSYQPVILPSSTLAIISVIMGIAGFSFLPLLGSIAALITGYMARKETRAIPPTASGDGLATAGIIMGWIQLALGVIGLCCFGAYFVFILGAVAQGQ
jgi:hypothetical protein